MTAMGSNDYAEVSRRLLRTLDAIWLEAHAESNRDNLFANIVVQLIEQTNLIEPPTPLVRTTAACTFCDTSDDELPGLVFKIGTGELKCNICSSCAQTAELLLTNRGELRWSLNVRVTREPRRAMRHRQRVIDDYANALARVDRHARNLESMIDALEDTRISERAAVEHDDDDNKVADATPEQLDAAQEALERARQIAVERKRQS